MLMLTAREALISSRHRRFDRPAQGRAAPQIAAWDRSRVLPAPTPALPTASQPAKIPLL